MASNFVKCLVSGRLQKLFRSNVNRAIKNITFRGSNLLIKNVTAKKKLTWQAQRFAWILVVPVISGSYVKVNFAACYSKTKYSTRDLCRAVAAGDLFVIKRLVEAGTDVNERHPLGWTALHVAAFAGNSEVVAYLIEQGADVNVCDNFSHPYKAAAHHQTSVIDVINLRDECFDGLKRNAVFSGFTPLHYAALSDDYQTVRLLIEAGADPTVLDKAGHLPHEYCGKLKSYLKGKYDEFGEKKEKLEVAMRKKYPIEQRFREAIVGQEGAINAVASAIRRRDNGWYDENHPLVFLFLGSSGIGKTELAKQLAKYLFRDTNKGFIRLDMSEYQEKHEVAKLIGAPPGYIGHDEGGQLTKKLKEFPKAVVLFDEVDKAHPDVLTIMLQLFDEGRLTDGHGKTIECKDAIFVMTSNLASGEIANHAIELRKYARRLSEEKRLEVIDKDPESITIDRTFKEGVVYPILKQHFKRDEFLGRITEFVYFLPFSKSELIQLVEKELKIWAERAQRRHSINLQWDEDVLGILADGYDIHYGARSIKHEVERKIVNQIAYAHERGVIKSKSTVHLMAEYSTGTPNSENETVKDLNKHSQRKPKIGMRLYSECEKDSHVISIDQDLDDDRPIFFS